MYSFLLVKFPSIDEFLGLSTSPIASIRLGEQDTDPEHYSSDACQMQSLDSGHPIASAPKDIPTSTNGVQTSAKTEEAMSSISYFFLQRQFGVYDNSFRNQSQENFSTSRIKPQNLQSLDIYSHSHTLSRAPVVGSASQTCSEHPAQQSPYSMLSELPSFVFPSAPSLAGQLYHNSSLSLPSVSPSHTQPPASQIHGHPHTTADFHLPPEPSRSSVALDLSADPLNTNPLVRKSESQTSDTFLQAESAPEFPSLGYLDEALSFIAAERARWTAARESTSGLNDGRNGSENVAISGDDDDDEDGLDHKEEAEGHVAFGKSSNPSSHWSSLFFFWAMVLPSTFVGEIFLIGVKLNLLFIDAEKEPKQQSKCKRRRKRSSKPPRSEILPDSLLPSTSSRMVQFPTPEFSPRKRRSKSAAPLLSASASMHSIPSEKSGTTTPGKRKGKRRDKEFLVPPPISPNNSKADMRAESDIDDGVRTPTNPKTPGLIDITTLSGINLLGKRGRRVGRREREREKLQFDMLKPAADNNANTSSLDSGFDVGEVHGGRNENEGTGQGNKEDRESQEENDSISNMSLLKPPRRKHFRREDVDGRHSVTSVHKNIQASPLELFSFRRQASRVAVQKPADMPKSAIDAPERNEKVGSKREERSLPSASSKSQTQAFELTPPHSKRGRLLTLAQNLQHSFPEQHDELASVIKRLMGEKKAIVSAGNSGSDGTNITTSKPISIPEKSQNTRKDHNRSKSEGLSTLGPDLGDVLEASAGHARTDVEQEKSEEELDPRGRPSTKKDPIIHVFIDQ